MKLNFCEEQGTVCILFILCEKQQMKLLQYTGFAPERIHLSGR